jgi:hypothetical protein
MTDQDSDSALAPETSGRHQVLVVGGGFGGVNVAKALAHADVDVTIADRTNHHLFQPLLYQVASGLLSEGLIAPPLRTRRPVKAETGEIAAARPQNDDRRATRHEPRIPIPARHCAIPIPVTFCSRHFSLLDMRYPPICALRKRSSPSRQITLCDRYLFSASTQSGIRCGRLRLLRH